MQVTSILQSVDLSSHASPVTAAEAAQRLDVLHAAKSVNDSGLLGQNQLVFLIDRTTHLPIVRVVDRETQEVVLQLPAEYVLRLARDEHTDSVQITSATADM